MNLHPPTQVSPQFVRRANSYPAAVIVLIGCLSVAAYYWWAIRATGKPVEWHATELRGYYNYLGRAFAAGQLHLPLAPSPELLALANPWDPTQNWDFRMHDMVLYNGRYYLYHGAGPAVLLFTPWRILTGHDLPEQVAVFVFCTGGFLLYLGALLRTLSFMPRAIGAGRLAVLLLALGVCQSAPYLCNRVDVYEVAIAGGYFCVAGAVLFLTLAATSSHGWGFLCAAGLLSGLAVSCRPHLGGFGAAGLLVLVACKLMRKREISWSGIAAYGAAFAAVGAAVASYNYLRFGEPTEFGLRYLLAGAVNQQRISLSWPNAWTGIYYFLACPPDFTPVFPWVRLAMRFPPAWSLPRDYFIEPVAGAILTAPFILLAAVKAGMPSAIHMVRWMAVLSAAVILLFVSATGFTTQRYVVDFLPLLVFASALAFAALTSRLEGSRRAAVTAVFSICVIYSVVVNLALGLTGPYDHVLSDRPASYVRIARWFSFSNELRPILNPALSVSLEMTPAPQADGFREPLLALGGQGSRHVLYLEHHGQQASLISRSETQVVPDVSGVIDNKPAKITFAYDPALRRITVEADGRTVLSQDLPVLVTAPAQLVTGSNGLTGFVGQSFSGRLRVIHKAVTIAPSR